MSSPSAAAASSLSTTSALRRPSVTEQSDGSVVVNIPDYANDKLWQLEESDLSPFASIVDDLSQRGNDIPCHITMAVAEETDRWLADLVRHVPARVQSFTVTQCRSWSLPYGPGSFLDAVRAKEGWTIDVFKLVDNDMSCNVATALAQSFLPHTVDGEIGLQTMAGLAQLPSGTREGWHIASIRWLLQEYTNTSGRRVPLPANLDEASTLSGPDGFHPVMGNNQTDSSDKEIAAAESWAEQHKMAMTDSPADPAEGAQRYFPYGGCDMLIDHTLRLAKGPLTTEDALSVTPDRFGKLKTLRVRGLLLSHVDEMAPLEKVLERCDEDPSVKLGVRVANIELPMTLRGSQVRGRAIFFVEDMRRRQQQCEQESEI